MSREILIAIAACFLALILVIVILARKIAKIKNQKQDKQSTLLLQQQINQLAKLIDGKFSETNRAMDSKLSEVNHLSQNQFKQSSQLMSDLTRESRELLHGISAQSQKTIKEVTEKLTKLDDTNRQVVGFSEQLKNLQDILKNPKQRGVLGEYYLEETLKNVLPSNCYQMQYRFENGEAVDAAIFVKDQVIPVDSKFSLETYEKILACNKKEERAVLEKTLRTDLKKRIDETAKYITPKEGTVSFAFMFIPSESLYYDLLTAKVASGVNARNLIEYAAGEKRVIIVSPTSFLAYLQTVLQGLRAFKIEESAKEIQKKVEALGKHLKKYEEYHGKLGKSLSTVVNHYNHSNKELGKVDTDIVKITETEQALQLEKEVVEKPL